ncbi:MAG: TadE/TadG family type IV pilus assembly protein [Actinomycetes bacterium]
MEWGTADSGQATVEFLLAVPLVIVLGWGVWQVSVAARTAELAGSAARAAARAAALGRSPRQAMLGELPSGLNRSASLRIIGGRAIVRLQVPAVGVGSSLGPIEAAASFPVQR